MGRKGRKTKGAASIKVKTNDVETVLLSMKKSRADATKQAKLCVTLAKFAKTSPILFRDSTINTEASLCVLLALKADPDDIVLRTSGCEAICALLLTFCCDRILTLGGAQALMTIMDQDKTNTKNLYRIIDTMGYLCQKDESNYGPLLVTAGFIQNVLKALKIHPDDIPIQSHGMQFLKEVISSCVHNQQLVKLSIDLVVHTMGRLGGNNNSLHHDWASDHCIRVLEQSCGVLAVLTIDHPNTTSTVQNAGGPIAVLSTMKHFPDQVSLQVLGIWALQQFAKNDDAVLQSECFQVVISALKSHYEHQMLQSVATNFIGTILKTKSGVLLIQSSGTVPFFFDLMRLYPDHEDFQCLGCLVVTYLGRRNETREAVLTEEAASLVAAATKACAKGCGFDSEDFTWGKCCLEAIACLMRFEYRESKGDVRTDILVREGIVKASIKVMKGTEAGKQGEDGGRQALFILLRLVQRGNSKTELEFAREGGVIFLLEIMRLNPGHRLIQYGGCHALGLLTTSKHPVILESIAKADGVNILMDAIEQFPHTKDIFNYGGSAALLTREFELGRTPSE